MKISFVQPYYRNIWEAIGVGYLGGYVKKCLPDTEMNFFQAYFDNDETIIKGCLDSDVVAFSTTSPSFNHGLQLATKLKTLNKNIKIVFGGWHVSALYSEIQYDIIDHIVVGEGEAALVSILNGARDKVIVGTKLGFDQLAWPDRHLIKNHRTIDLCEKAIGLRVASFQSNRVCPMSCAYCTERSVSGRFNRETNPIRYRDSKDIFDEIESVVADFNINYFKLVDATFDSSKDHVISFCEEKIKRGLYIDWECMIHANFIDEETMKYLKMAGCNQIDIGCESGSPKLLKDMRKGTTIEKISQVFQWAKTNDIKRRAFFILGMPNETEDDYKLTEDLIDRIRPDIVGFTILCPYPGSDFYSRETYGSIDWSQTDEYSNDFWRTTALTNIELKDKQKTLTNKYKDSLCFRQKDV